MLQPPRESTLTLILGWSDTGIVTDGLVKGVRAWCLLAEEWLGIDLSDILTTDGNGLSEDALYDRQIFSLT